MWKAVENTGKEGDSATACKWRHGDQKFFNRQRQSLATWTFFTEISDHICKGSFVTFFVMTKLQNIQEIEVTFEAKVTLALYKNKCTRH